MVKSFEELVVWQESIALYIQLEKERKESAVQYFFFRDQLLRAGLSISNNIAEGFERFSNNEFRRFLYISKGSCGEVRSMLIIARDAGYLGGQIVDTLYDKTKKISIMIHKLIQSLPTYSIRPK